jgi:branched-chain amino acid aminotransferase
MSPTSWIWKDGRFVHWDDARIHVLSHVVHYGSSVFEGIRCYSTPDGPAIFRLRDHVRRLFRSCRIYRMEPNFTPEEIEDAIAELIDRNGLDSAYVRPVVFRGYEVLGLDPRPCPVEAAIAAWPWDRYLGEDSASAGVDIKVSSWRRLAPDTLPATAKAGANYISSQLIKMEALDDGYAEAVALDTEGFVSEGSAENIFVVFDDVLYTPPWDSSVLVGITRDSVMKLARDLGIDIKEQRIPREILYVADEVFLCGTAAEITPVRSVDHLKVGMTVPGPITGLIGKTFDDLVHGRIDDRRGWLHPVKRFPPPATAASAPGIPAPAASSFFDLALEGKP